MRKTLSFLGMLLIAVPTIAANLLSNPNFNSNLSGWTIPSSVMIPTWSPADALGSPASGSASLRNVWELAPGTGPAFYQCVPASQGAAYDVGARIHIPEGQSTSGFVQTYVSFYPGPGCTGTILTSQHAATLQNPTRRFIANGAPGVIAPPATQSARVEVVLIKSQAGGSWTVNVDDVFFGPTGDCLPTLTDLCLANGRFRVQTAYNTTSGASGSGQAVQLTADSGYFWFFNADNAEMIVKVLRGCDINNRYWVFAGGLTNVNVVMTVTDTNTDQTRTYTNPQITPFAPIQDTSAFATCP